MYKRQIQYRDAEPSEVLAAGGRVLNMVDLADVYMTFFLPTEQAGLLALGSEARLVLDAAPDLVIPANNSFVASAARALSAAARSSSSCWAETAPRWERVLERRCV